MLLAHGSESGPNLEALMLALPMVVVGIILFVQKTAKPIVPVVLVLGGIAIGVSALTIFDGDDHDVEASPSAGPGAYVGAVTGLCEAERVAAPEPEEAGRIFENDVHLPLHELAAEVGEEDRGAAAALLEAKETVESEMAGGAMEGEILEDHLGALHNAAVGALEAIDVEAPAC